MEIDVTDETFNKEVLEKSNEILVVVDFWASWCNPCMIIKPLLEKIAQEYEGKFILAKLNVDENPEKAKEYKIMSIPAIKMFKNGKVVNEFMGVIPEDKIREFIDDCL